MLKLYYASGTCALATHLALEFSGADYEAIRVDFSKQEQRSPEYLRINPKGRVPVLVTDRGILTENPALLMYIAQSFPQSKLAPLDDPFALAKMNAFNTYLCSTVHVAHAHKGRGHRWTDDESAIEAMKKKVTQNMGDCFDLIEREMFEGPWVMGEDFSVADCYLFTIGGWLKGDSVDIERFPKVAAQRARMLADAKVMKVIDKEQAA